MSFAERVKYVLGDCVEQEKLEQAGELFKLGLDWRMASLAFDIGHALPGQDDESLRKIRNVVATTKFQVDFRNIYLSGVLEVIDGYRLSMHIKKEQS